MLNVRLLPQAIGRPMEWFLEYTHGSLILDPSQPAHGYPGLLEAWTRGCGWAGNSWAHFEKEATSELEK